MASSAADIAKVPRTIAELPFFAAGRFPKPDTLGRCRGDRIERISARELVERVRDLSLGLSSVGMERGSHVVLLSESRPEWLIADLAVLTAGAITTPIYPTLSAEQIEFILRDCGATIAIVSSAALLDKVRLALPSVPNLRTIVAMDVPADESGPVPVLTFDDVAARGHQRILAGWGVAKEFQDVAKSIGPDDLATIIYTSGTTGEPKGVMLTHGNLISNVAGVLDVLELRETDVSLSFLPLCHAFERLVSYVYLTTGVSVVFAESFETVARDLLAVKPTLMTGVPRVFEKLHARVFEKGREGGGVKRALFEWGARVAHRRGERLPAGKPLSPWLRLSSAVADRLIFSKVRDRIGGRLRYSVSGSAPLNPDIARFFYGIGFPILEGYGLTETSPVIAVTPLAEARFGTVGPPLPNVDVRIAPDGEILVRGPNVMRGYYSRPADTAAVMADGWFHTGDIGTLDERGYLAITDRKKELLVTSGGKKIAPQPIEERLRAHPLVGEAVLLGDNRHFPAALIVPDFQALAKALGADVAAVRARVGDAPVRALYEKVVAAVNEDLAQFERIKKFELLAEEFSVSTGELTPTLKFKRRVVEDKYRTLIERLYA